ncbi:HD domain-containing protein [Candidatus Pacearchaeota archaeon]|nr:HD domain-containing protein [Candidatus Pacearchaeota archaeon]
MDKIKFLRICENKNFSKSDLELFEKAIEICKKEFADKKKLCGQSFFEQNLTISYYLAESGLSKEVIIAGLLYGFGDFSKKYKEELVTNFGKEVFEIIKGQKQLEEIKSNTKVNTESETLRQILLATITDVRVIFVKIAYKLNSLRTAHFLSESEKKTIADESLEIYAPLAGRLGLEFLKRQIEDEAFKLINPKKYSEINNFLKESQKQRETFVKDFISDVEGLLSDIKIHKIKGRNKHIYSIYKKIQKRTPLKEQKDHFAIRIVTNSVEDCYNVLGILNKNYSSVKGTLKDYILNPKPNSYQSLHIVLEVKDKEIEVQIRTRDMDFFAEEGGAAHWNYKKLSSDFNFEKKLSWLKSFMENSDSQEDKNLLNIVKASLFGDRFYCYTPKGKAISLPENSSALDFAYFIHNEIGDRTVGVRINGIYKSIKTKLKQGDVVEVITNRYQKPRREWLRFVASARAKSAIRKSIKRNEGIAAPSNVCLDSDIKKEFASMVFSEDFPNHKMILAQCCCPYPNEELLGIIKTHKKILVHSKRCRIKEKVKDKIVPVYWKEILNKPIRFFIEAEDRSGVLADFLNTITRQGFVVKEAKANLLGKDIAECCFTIIPQEIDKITDLVSRIQKIYGFKKIRFE